MSFPTPINPNLLFRTLLKFFFRAFYQDRTSVAPRKIFEYNILDTHVRTRAAIRNNKEKHNFRRKKNDEKILESRRPSKLVEL